MDWIHCNTCFNEQNVNSTKQQLFYITGCGYIFCKNCGCTADGSSYRCKGCKNKCSRTLVGGEMKPKILKYFQDPLEEYEKLLKVMQFQKSHRMKLISHNRYIKLRYNKAKVYIKKLENEIMIAKNALLNTSKNQSQSLISNHERIDINSTIHFGVPDIRHRKQSFQNELSLNSMGSEVSTGSSSYAGALLNIPKNQGQSLISDHERIDTNSTFHFGVPDIRHRKQSFQNELSLNSTGSEDSTGSSSYAGALLNTPKKQGQSLISNHKRIDTDSTFHMAVPDMKHWKQSFQNEMGSKVPIPGSSSYASALLNTPKKQGQSLISNHKRIDTDSTFHMAVPDMKHWKQSFQNELSLNSTGSEDSTGSSSYAGALLNTPKKQGQSLISNHKRIDTDSTFHMAVPDMKHWKQSFQNEMGSKVPIPGSSSYASALLNTPKKQGQSLISNHKRIDTDSTFHMAVPDMKHWKQSFQNELSLNSTGSEDSTGSSSYAGALLNTPKKQGQSLISNHKRIDTDSTFHMAVPDMKHWKQSFQNEMGSKVPIPGSSSYASALLNTPKKQGQSLISNHKRIDTDSTFHMAVPDMKHWKQSFQNELSLNSTGSEDSTGSSSYAGALLNTPKKQGQSLISNHKRIDTDSTFHMAVPDMKHWKQSFQNEMGSKVPIPGSSSYASALLNTPKKQGQSLISNHKRIDTDSTFHMAVPDMKNMKQSFRNEISLNSMGSKVSTSGSSSNASPLQESSDENYIQTLNNLNLNTFRKPRNNQKIKKLRIRKIRK